MRNFLLLVSLIISNIAFSQKVAVIVNSPAGVAGEKSYGGADFGADLTSNTWTGDLVMGDPIIGCDPLTNASAIAGKFCVIDRLTCSFDVKCLNAQDAGAIAVVIMNHNLSNAGGPPFKMANGNVGAGVTIPCIMLGYEDGLAIKSAMQSGTVNMTIGAFAKEANDLAIARTTCDGTYSQPLVLHPKYGAVPSSQIQSVGDMSFVTGGSYTNNGTQDQPNCKVNCIIKKTGNSIYDKTSDKEVAEVDSTRTGVIVDPFDYNGQAVGQYSINYLANNDGTERFLQDNNYSSYFDITSNILSKSRFNMATRAPVTSGAYLFGGGTAYRELMMPFRLKHGKGLQLDSIYAVVSTGGGSVADLYLEGRLYRWDDLDADGQIATEEMTLVALGSKTFDATDTRASANFSIALENLEGTEPVYQVKDDGELYLASIQYSGGAQSLFFGYDSEFNQKLYVDYKDALNEFDFDDYPFLTSQTQAASGGPDMSSAALFYFDCNGNGVNDAETVYGAASIAVFVSKAVVATKDISNGPGINIELSPNPARDILKANIKLADKSAINYNIVDINGKIISSMEERNSSDQFNPVFNVSQLSQGQYFLQVNTPKGFLKKSFFVVK
ncbi:MAG: PA domain-containing protein [Saprospiraceae bacterium]